MPMSGNFFSKKTSACKFNCQYSIMIMVLPFSFSLLFFKLALYHSIEMFSGVRDKIIPLG